MGLVSFSCKKTEADPVDYRDRFVGTYKGSSIKIVKTYNGVTGTTTIDSTIDNNVALIFTKTGDYPSQKVSWGSYQYTLQQSSSNVNKAAFSTRGWNTVYFDFPNVHIYGVENGTGDKETSYNCHAVKQ